MYAALLTFLVLDGLFLSVVILLQSGKGGGLAAMGGGAAATEGILGGRQATTVLTRATWTSGTLFMVLALVLSILSSRSQVPQSILTPEAAPLTTAPQPLIPGDAVNPINPGATDPAAGAAAGAAGADTSGAGNDGN